jgi:hypothetical protein
MALVENVPVPQLAIAAQIDGSSKKAANGHANVLEASSRIDLRFASLKKLFERSLCQSLGRGCMDKRQTQACHADSTRS